MKREPLIAVRYRVVVFGGTTEGRRLCEFCSVHEVPIRYCAATADGTRPVESLPNVMVHAGRLDAKKMALLLKEDSPALVIDATHPYALEASCNITKACQSTGFPLVRVVRESTKEQGCLRFSSMDDLLARLATERGNIFVTLGSSAAKAFAKLPDFQNRVWLRILPNLDSLRICLDSGYRPERLICMQGPFLEELNIAMFKNANAKILVTKNSGAAGGFAEKLRAAQSLGMITAVLSKPEEPGGISLDEVFTMILEL